jgi:hypothetical protein
LTLRDVAVDLHSVVTFINKKLRYARAMGILARDNGNWHGVMIQIWSSMTLDIRQHLRAPSQKETLTMYMLQVKQSLSLLSASARDQYPQITGNQSLAGRSTAYAKQAYSTVEDNTSFSRGTYSSARNGYQP